MVDEIPDRDKFAWNTMVVAYVNSVRLTKVMQPLYDTPLKSSIAWLSLASRCKYGYKNEALNRLGIVTLRDKSLINIYWGVS